MGNEVQTVARMDELEVQAWSSPMHELAGPEGKTFSPVTSALVLGKREAVLVDAQLMTSDADAVGDWIERTGRTLKAIYITHGHGDHYFGAGRLAARFETARIVAEASTVDYIRKNEAKDIPHLQAMFKDPSAVETPKAIPEALQGDTIDLEGHSLEVISVEQADMSPSTLLWVPGLDVAIVGDAVYNRTHMMMATTALPEWKKWADSIRLIGNLKPKAVVTGHRQPGSPDDDIEAIVGGSERYILDYIRLAESAKSADELVGGMVGLYPAWTNPSTLLTSAAATMKAKG